MATRSGRTYDLDIRIDGNIGAFDEIARNAVGRELNPKLREAMRLVVDRQFNSRGGLTGGWAPLSPRYAAWKAMHYPGKPLLERTYPAPGSLRWAAQHPEIRLLVRGVVATVRNGYGAYHQDGTGRMPARPPIPLEALSVGWSHAWSEYIVNVIRHGQPARGRRSMPGGWP